jgi:ATP-binding cassette, sub-family E, member 1
MIRIAIVDKEKCKPSKCQQECIKKCPVQRTGKEVIKLIDIEDLGKNANTQLSKNKIIEIVESSCIGCNQCVSACPFNAIKIIKLPERNPHELFHRYAPNSFVLYKFIEMKKNCVMSIIGQNGIGKTTVVDILSNNSVPNFGVFDDKILMEAYKKIIKYFKGTSMLDYFKNLYSNKITFSIKQQKIKHMINEFDDSISVSDYLHHNNVQIDSESKIKSFNDLELSDLLNNKIFTLSGGELQRLLCWTTANKQADFYIFDEPSNFLDIKQRMKVAELIKNLSSFDKYVLVVEHDLSMLDYMADNVVVLYGKPGVYGIVSDSMSLSSGLNDYLDGFLPSQNTRIRNEPFNLMAFDKIQSSELDTTTSKNALEYDSNIIVYDKFELTIPQGKIKLDGSINIILGENGTGKTTFMNYISSKEDYGISHKPQHVNLNNFNSNMTVLELFYNNIKTSYLDPVFQSDVVKTLNIQFLEEKCIKELSGGELQKVMICFTLGKPANIYLLDEPSSNLDIDSRLECIKAIKKFANNSNKCLFIIEHDIMMSVAWSQESGGKILLAKKNDSLIKTDGIKRCSISEPLDFKTGINLFLKEIDITMRISGHNRPRINKMNSRIDKEQKKNNTYYGNGHA